MWPASPQSITRCAMLMPAPATLAQPFTSTTPLTGPLLHTHAHAQICVLLFDRATDLQRAFHRIFRAVIEDQRHPIAGRDCEQTLCRFLLAKLVRRSDDLV